MGAKGLQGVQSQSHHAANGKASHRAGEGFFLDSQDHQAGRAVVAEERCVRMSCHPSQVHTALYLLAPFSTMLSPSFKCFLQGVRNWAGTCQVAVKAPGPEAVAQKNVSAGPLDTRSTVSSICK